MTVARGAEIGLFRSMLPKLLALAIAAVSLVDADAKRYRPAGQGSGPTARAWQARMERAKETLAKPGIDACQSAGEVGFQTATEDATQGRRVFFISLAVNDEAMVAAYFYEGERFSAFSIGALPPKWYAMQKRDSKTLTVNPAGVKCVFDLCTSDPLADGACPENQVPK